MAPGKHQKKICIVTTVDSSLYVLFPGFFPLLLEKGFEVVGICADGPWLEKVRAQGIRVITVPMERGFAPWSDLKCFCELYRIFRREKFDLIHYSTPKAALLAGLAGRAVHCPALLCTLRGLGYMAFGGLKRLIGKFCERIACRCAHYVIAISKSLKKQAAKEKLLPANRINILGVGSSKGVNIDQFQRNEKNIAEAKKIRRQFNIDDNGIVLGYAGRLTEEKGIVELINAFTGLRKIYSNLHLLLIGHIDQRSPFSQETSELLNASQYIHVIPFKDNLPDYLAVMDILVLPSYREGFGNSLIEASAMQVPVVATDIPGCRDAVIDGTTGILVKPRDIVSLRKTLNELIENPSKRMEMGRRGRQWVAENFDRNLVWSRQIKLYEQLLRQRRN